VGGSGHSSAALWLFAGVVDGVDGENAKHHTDNHQIKKVKLYVSAFLSITWPAIQ
jgi:hypothetical protein